MTVPALALPQVTLCAIDARTPQLALESLQRSMALVSFGRAVLFTHGFTPAEPPAGIELVDSGPIASAAAYSHFVLRRLPGCIGTSHVLVTQWDGFVVDAAAWRDDFLACDYIGAVWPDQPVGLQVGNGGFSLRSQRLLQAGLDTAITDEHPEDEMLARRHRAWLERAHGVRFAPVELARRFACENERPGGATFGFHGPVNLPRLLDEPTLARWLAQLPKDFYRSRDARRLARALWQARMPRLAGVVAERRLAAGRRDPNAHVLAFAGRWARRLGLD